MKEEGYVDIIVRDGKEYKIYDGSTIDKGILFEEDFVKIFKDSDDKII